MTRFNTGKMMFVVAACGVLTLAGPARAATWDGGGSDNNWFTDANWNPGTAPNGAIAVAEINSQTSAANPVIVNGNVTLQDFTLGDSDADADYVSQSANTVTVTGDFKINATGFYTLSGGTLDLSSAPNTTWKGNFTQTGGTVNAKKYQLDGAYHLSGGNLNGTFRLRSGDLIQTSGTLFTKSQMEVGIYGTSKWQISGATTSATVNSIQFAFRGNGTIEQTGGAFTSTGYVRMGDAGNNQSSTAQWTITGGTANVTSGNVEVYYDDGGTSTLTVGDAGELSITDRLVVHRDTSQNGQGIIVLDGSGTGGITAGTYAQTGGILKPRIDAGGVVRIAVTGQADFIDGAAGNDALLDPEALAGAQAGTYTVMTFGSLSGSSNLSFAAGVDTSKWSFAFVDDDGVAGGAGELQLTLVPEPSSGALALLGLGGLVILPRRRKVSSC